MYENFREFLCGKQRLCIIQAANPDGDSLGSALGLAEILATSADRNDKKTAQTAGTEPIVAGIANSQKATGHAQTITPTDSNNDKTTKNTDGAKTVTATENIGNSKNSTKAATPIQNDNAETPAPDFLVPGLQVTHFCPVNLPKYLHYFAGWDTVDINFDLEADGYIIVDTASEILLSKLLQEPAIKNKLFSVPVFVLDHHETPDDLPFPHELICEPRPACAELIFALAQELELTVSPVAADALIGAIAADTLGMVSPAVTAETFATLSALTRFGGSIARVDEARRELMKKSKRILAYKGELISRVEYFLDGRLALVHIPWEDIRLYSDEYNPGVLIIEELKMVTGVQVAAAIKTYPDGKVTGKLRTSVPIADTLAGFWGGGGHPFAAGFRTFDSGYDEVVNDLIRETMRLLPPPLTEPEPEHDTGNRLRIGKMREK